MPKNTALKPYHTCNLEQFSPVNPEEIYIKLYNLEKEIKRHEPDMYFRVKEFTLKDESEITYPDIHSFSEDITHTIFKKKKIDAIYLRLGEDEFQRLMEELCFEIMYHKLFVATEEEEDIRSMKLQEKAFILQNLITPSMIGIKDQHYSYNVYQLAFAELKKLNSVKSPSNKCRVIFESINCLSGMFKNKMPSAEELFPILVYLFLGANPPHIALNLSYIEKFLSPGRRVGKEGYILTNLGAALSFIERIDADALLKGKVQLKQY